MYTFSSFIITAWHCVNSWNYIVFQLGARCQPLIGCYVIMIFSSNLASYGDLPHNSKACEAHDKLICLLSQTSNRPNFIKRGTLSNSVLPELPSEQVGLLDQEHLGVDVAAVAMTHGLLQEPGRHRGNVDLDLLERRTRCYRVKKKRNPRLRDDLP